MNFVYAEEIVDLVTNNREWIMREIGLLKNIIYVNKIEIQREPVHFGSAHNLVLLSILVCAFVELMICNNNMESN